VLLLIVLVYTINIRKEELFDLNTIKQGEPGKQMIIARQNSLL